MDAQKSAHTSPTEWIHSEHERQREQAPQWSAKLKSLGYIWRDLLGALEQDEVEHVRHIGKAVERGE